MTSPSSISRAAREPVGELRPPNRSRTVIGFVGGCSGDLAITEMSGVGNAIGFQGERTHAQVLADRQNAVENPPRRCSAGVACGAARKSLRPRRTTRRAPSPPADLVATPSRSESAAITLDR